MDVPIHPLSGYVVAQTELPEPRTTSGLYVPVGSQEKPKTARIVAVGEGTTQIEVGDQIIYKGFSTTEVSINKQDYILLKEEDILATVN